ncbi:WAS/WASL-interacting protein family member 1-like [Eucalyptus grandis]|uniref:WAS/WASL-interacting protein family member 1-like n=1 Tax=Eucalyptus grandis TaxID=71139 RepID=UPI00192F0E1A|nr:WAS/WASL-interacting protein family member 1-like [Eucalyptus grandis]
MASRASGQPEVSGCVVEGERRWPRAGISERWCRGRATVPSRANGEPEVSRGAVEGERRWPRPSSRDQPQWRRGRPAVASRLEGGRRWRRAARWRTDGQRGRPRSLSRASEGGLESSTLERDQIGNGFEGDRRWRRDSRATGGGVERDGERTGEEVTAVLSRRAKVASSPRPSSADQRASGAWRLGDRDGVKTRGRPAMASRLEATGGGVEREMENGRAKREPPPSSIATQQQPPAPSRLSLRFACEPAAVADPLHQPREAAVPICYNPAVTVAPPPKPQPATAPSPPAADPPATVLLPLALLRSAQPGARRAPPTFPPAHSLLPEPPAAEALARRSEPSPSDAATSSVTPVALAAESNDHASSTTNC